MASLKAGRLLKKDIKAEHIKSLVNEIFTQSEKRK